ncbi:MAG: hypothetical protein MHM6MM_009374 [Cercozoa sp. M6MM]
MHALVRNLLRAQAAVLATTPSELDATGDTQRGTSGTNEVINRLCTDQYVAETRLIEVSEEATFYILYAFGMLIFVLSKKATWPLPLRLFEAASRAPVYALFDACLGGVGPDSAVAGIDVVRQAQRAPLIRAHLWHRLDINTGAELTFQRLLTWYAFWIDVVGIVALVLAALEAFVQLFLRQPRDHATLVLGLAQLVIMAQAWPMWTRISPRSNEFAH